MAALSPDVSAALASLQARWGAAAPRVAGEQSSASPRVIGALATVPLPDEAEPDEALLDARPLHHETPLPGGHGVERIVRTGFPVLDPILGPGRLPRSPNVAFRGDASSRKTTLPLRFAAEAQVDVADVALPR